MNRLTVDVLKVTKYSCKKTFIDGFMNLKGPKHKYLNIGTFDCPELYPPDIELPYELFPGQEKQVIHHIAYCDKKLSDLHKLFSFKNEKKLIQLYGINYDKPDFQG